MTRCAVCRFPIGERFVHSKHTDLWYCLDLDDCYRRGRNELTYEEIRVYAEMIMRHL